MKRKNIFWGVSLIAIAIFIVVYQMGLISNEISIWSIVLGILFGCALIEGIISLSFGGIFFSLAFLWALFGEAIGLPGASIWILLLAALLLTIGFSTIFPKKKKEHEWKEHMESMHQTFDTCGAREVNENGEQTEASGNVSCYNKFGATTKYVTSSNFVSATLENHFGEMIVYFDNARIVGEDADIYVKASFGSVQLYLPREWRVENNINVTMGEVSEKNQSKSTGTPVVRLNGDVSLGDLKITYI